MGWSIGYDENWKRDIGYGVPAVCDHPECNVEIDRGLSYVCCNEEPRGGDDGCGLYFCGEHRFHVDSELLQPAKCDRCNYNMPPFEPKPDTQEWLDWKETDPSWQAWRDARLANLNEHDAGEI